MVAGDTPWKTGRLDAHQGKQQLLFGRMYEDASIEINAFHQRGRIMCIASAGCTAMKLAPFHDEVVAVDINPLQIAYARERFNGQPGYKGKAEKIMDLMRRFGPLVGWWTFRLKAFVDLDSTEKQMTYWHTYLNTFRFRKIFDFVFSRTVLRTFYSAELLKLLPENLGEVMRYRMERCFAHHINKYNPYIRTLLLGDLNPEQVPPEAKNIKLVESDALHYLENVPPESFNGFSLSNILDGADTVYQQKLFAAVKKAAAPGAIMVLRSFNSILLDSKQNSAGEDRSMLWGSVLVIPASDL